MSDPIWEHKKGKVWVLVRDLSQENERLRKRNRHLRVALGRVLASQEVE